MVLEEISLNLCYLLQRNFIIDLLLSSTLHHNVTFAERNHFVMNNLQNALLCSSVYQVWLGQNGCENEKCYFVKCDKIFGDILDIMQIIYFITNSSFALRIYFLSHFQCFCCSNVSVTRDHNQVYSLLLVNKFHDQTFDLQDMKTRHEFLLNVACKSRLYDPPCLQYLVVALLMGLWRFQADRSVWDHTHLVTWPLTWWAHHIFLPLFLPPHSELYNTQNVVIKIL